MSTITEEAIAFPCAGETLCGIVHRPETPAARGVLMIVGGPEYRVGSHRLYVEAARALAGAGVPVMRFDYRGMGDSEGIRPAFDKIADDIRCAADSFQRTIPEVAEVTLWGLCDGASAAVLYAGGDRRIAGMVLLNPWARSDLTLARAYLRHYYGKRFLSPAFWGRLLRGEVDVSRAFTSFVDTARCALAGESRSDGAGERAGDPGSSGRSPPLNRRLVDALEQFTGRVLVIYSSNDITALEFKDTVEAELRHRHDTPGPELSSVDITGADHTFSHRGWRDEVFRRSVDFVRGG